MPRPRQAKAPQHTASPRRLRWWLLFGGALLLSMAVISVLVLRNSKPVLAEAPEFGRVQGVQADAPFQILIPAYLPKGFDRASMTVQVSASGPSGEPMAQLTYRTKKNATLFLREWVPTNPEIEILAGSRPIETKWGKGWLLTQGSSLLALWVDVGPLRVSVYSPDTSVLPREEILGIANNLGPASNNQVFSFIVDKPVVKDVPPPPPFEPKLNAQGVQEFTLVVTPGGYSPLRISVRKGVPVKMTFRQLGPVGCGNELNFPADPQNLVELRLASEEDSQVLEFTPQTVGAFTFFCSHNMYRGVLMVHE